MTEREQDKRAQAMVWFAVLGPPIAWVFQFVLGYGVSEATCGPAGRELQPPYDTWQVVVMAAAAVVALTGVAAAALAFRRVRGSTPDDPPPRGRIYFFSLVALAATPLFLAMILMSGIGSLILEQCHQS